MGGWGRCSVCDFDSFNPIGSAYGNVCSRECFHKLCDDRLGISLKDFQQESEIIEYDIPIQGEEDCDRQNKTCKEMFGDMYIPIQPTEHHVEILMDKLVNAIQKIGDNNGWYVGDGIKVSVELKYDPEDK